MHHQDAVGLRQELELVGAEDDRLALEEPREALVEQMPSVRSDRVFSRFARFCDIYRITVLPYRGVFFPIVGGVDG